MHIATQLTFTAPQDQAVLSDESLVLHKHLGKPVNKRLVIFIHGLGGNRYGNDSTWGNFPRFLFDDFPRLDIGLYSYRSALRRIRFWRSIPLPDESEVLASTLRTLEQYTAIVLVGHSLGGILAKGAIAYLANTNQKKTLRRLVGLILMASPQLGSLRVPGFLRRFSKDLKSLWPHNAYLRSVNQVFTDRFDLREGVDLTKPWNLPTCAILAAADYWVDPLSASIGLNSSQVFRLSGTHTSLVKPATRNFDAYIHVVAWVTGCTKCNYPNRVREIDGWETLEYQQGAEEDLPDIWAMAKKYFGDAISPLDQIRSWLPVDPEAVWVIRRVQAEAQSRVTSLVGYFCILRLSDDASSRMKQGALTAADIGATDLLPPGSGTGTAYIGALAGEDLAARALVLVKARERLRTMGAGKPLPLLTRPMSADGLRIALQNRLTPLNRELAGVGQLYGGVLDPVGGKRV